LRPETARLIANTRHAAFALLFGFLAVSAGLLYWQVIRAGSLTGEAGNPRAALAARLGDRGRILDRNGNVLAQSVVQSDGDRVRSYSLPSLAQTAGYLSARFGLSGVEAAENDQLTGAAGANQIDRTLNDLFHLSSPGNDVLLTIDSALQKAAAAALGERRGAVVALDPHSGAVLAMVSSPSFDAGSIDGHGDALLKDPASPLLNRATQGLYPPGSVYKIITAAAALDSGLVKPEDRYRCVNGVVIQGFVIQCENAPPGQTEWDFKTAFAYSINATFAQVAEQIGSDRFIDYSRRFGMDQQARFDIPAATSTTSRSGGGLDPVLLANSGFGQGQLLVTPLQMALVAATVANGGVEPEPYLVQEVRAQDGSLVEQHQPGSGHAVFSAQTAQTLTQFMVAAVQEFGQAAGLTGMDVAGKTGTAETGTPAAAHSWFVGFTPTGAPGIVVAAIVENGGPGSQVAAPIARQVFQAFLGQGGKSGQAGGR
jgi:peptidoglycan glycosyltransferase